MAPIDVTFDLPAKIAAGLADSTFIRNGGVIQDNAGRVVTWLRETPNGELSLQPATSIVSAGGASSLTSFAGVGSVLTLGASVLGFAVIYAKVKELEGRLQEVQKMLETVDQKIDLSFYANFRAALDLARNGTSATSVLRLQSPAQLPLMPSVPARVFPSSLALLGQAVDGSDARRIAACSPGTGTVACHSGCDHISQFARSDT